MKYLFVLLLFVIGNQRAIADSGWYDFFDRSEKITHGFTYVKIQTGFFKARASDKINVIYLHGYADTMDNHEELILSMRRGGARVFSFDFPGHGQSGGFISTWDLKDVAKIIGTYLKAEILNSNDEYKIDRTLPLVLVGWSTGGTIAVRIAQAWSAEIIPEDLRLKGVVAIEPAIPSQLFVGDSAIYVENSTLTRNPSRIRREPKPKTTLGSVLFAKSIVAQGLIAKASYFPSDLHGLILLGGDEEDQYANAGSTAQWVRSHGENSYLRGFQCAGGYHGLEFEPDGISAEILSLTNDFLSKMSKENDHWISPVFRDDSGPMYIGRKCNLVQ